MTKPKVSISPPRWSLRLLRSLVRKDYLEEIEGDLEEIYADFLEKYSVKKSRRLYNLEALKVLRPVLIRKVAALSTSNHFTLLRHNLITSLRGFRRYKTSFITNLLGLSTAMTVSLFIFLWVSDEQNVDKFHEHDDRLYQVIQNRIRPDGIRTDQSTPALLANALKETIPEIEWAVTSNHGGVGSKGILTNEDKSVEVRGTYASEHFFQTFSYGLVQGDEKTVLEQRNQIALSVSTANALFGTSESIIGKTVKANNDLLGEVYTITGVFEDNPYHSTAQFDFVISYKTVFHNIAWLNDWYADGANTYLLLKAGTDPEQLNAKVKRFFGDIPEREGNELFIQPYSSRYLHGTYSNGQPSGGRITYIRLFSAVSAFILLMACINFVNLSTAQGTRRMKEVGLKKTLGVKRKTLVFQFMTETLLTMAMALLLSALFVALLLPVINEVTGKILEHNIGLTMVYRLAGLAFLTGVISGLYPAFYLSRFKTIAVLKQKVQHGLSHLWIRKGLVTFQFILTVVFVITFRSVNQQVQFVQQAELGYDRESLIHFRMRNRKEQQSFLNALRNIPGVNQATYQTGGSVVGLRGGGSGFSWGDPLIQEDIRFARPHVGYDFIETLGVGLLEGRDFSRDFANEDTKLIINESAARIIGIPDIVGKTIMDSDVEKQVIGIVKDFKTQSLYEEVQPTIMRFTARGSDILVNLSSADRYAAIDKIESLYDQFNQEYPFEFSFVEDEYQRLYVAEQRVASLSGYFTAIATIISFLGLLGLVAFVIQGRIKEVGIRKVLGLQVIGTIRLLSIGITKTILLATVIALPLSYLLVDRWLNGFAYRIDLSWQVFVLTGLSILFFTWLLIALRLLNTARINPIHFLRNE